MLATQARDDAARPFDWVGFAVRFVLGGLLGALLSFRVIIELWTQDTRVISIAIAATILFCALASGFGGDAFWRAIRPGGMWRWLGRDWPISLWRLCREFGSGNQFACARLAGGTIPFIRKYSTSWP
jgi:hypothetical protein